MVSVGLELPRTSTSPSARKSSRRAEPKGAISVIRHRRANAASSSRGRAIRAVMPACQPIRRIRYPDPVPPDQRTLDQLSLSREEYDRIVHLLDREPNEVELGMFGALWSEHCGYKNSKPLLKLFPNEGAGVLTKAGEENAGVIDIGDGLCVAFKIESHNHPSAIEPYEGAATGVGGIVRDIFAMGARPVAILD